MYAVIGYLSGQDHICMSKLSPQLYASDSFLRTACLLCSMRALNAVSL